MTLLHPLVLLVIIVTVVKSDLLTSTCDATNNYTANSTYEANLNKLQSSLLSSIITSGFSNNTVGQYPDQVFGLALCRGDLSAESCQTCIRSTISEVRTRCPYGKDEKIWYDECFLHYSDTNFFSTMRHFGYYGCSAQNATDPEQFATILGQLMNTIVSQAASSSKMFAAGFVNYTSFNKLYGMAQCTQDLSKEDCYQCLQGCLENIPFYCDRKLGGRLYGESCNIRFQMSIFYNTSAVPNAAATPTPPAAPPPVETPNKENNGGSTNVARIAILVVGPAFAALVILLAIYACLRWAKKKHKPLQNIPYNDENETMGTTEGSLLFDLSTIRSATNNFSEENRLGEGGFGSVYKGKLVNGQEIAVKRLSGNSHQGLDQLKNEVKLLAKLQHKNLVKLFGCCLDGSEKLLVYEYLSNTSLDNFLFDPAKRHKLDWQMRLKIIEGITRGLVYLHEDSRLKIVHRDLKVSNILLDADMNPKISDFGLAKLFNLDATHANTSRIAGTYGYMAPEYAMGGIFSTKSDVFSYGILVLEILTARPIHCMPGQMEEGILSSVWRHWSQGEPLEAIDKSVSGHCPSQELIRCIHIALLCVQEDPSERPDMATVLLMLRSQSMTLSTPMAPRFFFRIVISTTGSQIPVTDGKYSTSMSENGETRRNF